MPGGCHNPSDVKEASSEDELEKKWGDSMQGLDWAWLRPLGDLVRATRNSQMMAIWEQMLSAVDVGWEKVGREETKSEIEDKISDIKRDLEKASSELSEAEDAISSVRSDLDDIEVDDLDELVQKL